MEHTSPTEGTPEGTLVGSLKWKKFSRGNSFLLFTTSNRTFFSLESHSEDFLPFSHFFLLILTIFPSCFADYATFMYIFSVEYIYLSLTISVFLFFFKVVLIDASRSTVTGENGFGSPDTVASERVDSGGGI